MVESLNGNRMVDGAHKFNDFRDLDVWRNCREIRKQIFRICKAFPKLETYRLADQMIRASRSATANIAEGYGRFHYQENIQFCRQARGSLYELIDHLTVSEESEYINASQCKNLIEKITAVIIRLNAYIKYLTNRKKENN